jgi:Zn-dependent protease with chaperone function
MNARAALTAFLCLALSACVSEVALPSDKPDGGYEAVALLDRDSATGDFSAVASRIEAMAETICRQKVRGRICDFTIAIDNRPDQPANAYQTLDNRGRPYIIFTTALIRDARNVDELAFVMGHEAAHHIAGHIPRRAGQAMEGAMLAGVLATVAGGSPDEVREARAVGADLAARQYSKEFELEADALGAEIAWRAGFDPLRGAAFFARLPDPGDRFLGSHPPNARRRAVVAQTVAALEAQ